MPDPNRYSDEWFEFFHVGIPAARTEQEVAFVRRCCPRPDFVRVLDVCCGMGRHARALAAHGYAVTGVERDERALSVAREQGGGPVYVRSDVRDYQPEPDSFDAVVILSQSFGYFEPDANRALLARLGAALRSGGRLVLDLWNPEFFLTRQGERAFDLPTGRVLETKRMENDRLFTRLDYPGGGCDEFEFQTFTEAEMASLARPAGLTLVAACTDFDAAVRPSADKPRVQFVLGVGRTSCVCWPVCRHCLVLTQAPVAQIGSLEIFWPLIEPILAALQPRRVCEIGVAAGALTERLLAWTGRHGGAYVGIDPAPAPQARERFATNGQDASGRRLLLQTSHAALPGLEPCDAYFLDGDHNYFTVRGELELITRVSGDARRRSPIIFMHDVGWPWGRRDMYYLPATVPPEARHPWSETLGVSLDGDELIEGGLREPGRYAIALRPGGAGNGVLTAVEDFLRGEEEAGWEMILLPVAYGFAVLHRAADPELPAACRERLADLRKMAATGGAFLQACEENFLRLYLHGEYYQHAAVTERMAHHATLQAYDNLLAHDRAIDEAYKNILAHSDALEGEYQKLRAAYEQLRARADAPQPPPLGTQFE